jgi:L-arabinokinase
MDQVTSCAGKENTLLRMICQPHTILAPLKFPDGVRVIGVNSNVKHSVGGGQYGITRCAAFMGHAIIVSKMREMGAMGGRLLVGDPMNGYLANLDREGYKQYFRPYLPEFMAGEEFLDKFKVTIDHATKVDPKITYPVQHAADHHVLEAGRVKSFCEHIEDAAGAGRDTNEGGASLDKAGHLMYASHLSYGVDAMLGAEECDLLVDLSALARKGRHLRRQDHRRRIGRNRRDPLQRRRARPTQRSPKSCLNMKSAAAASPRRLPASSPGAWEAGTQVIN